MIKEMDIGNEKVAQEIWELQQASYLVEAKWLGTKELPPLKETVAELRTCGESFITYSKAGKLVGVLAYQKEKQDLAIHRLFISPSVFREGIAQALLAHLEREDYNQIRVMTGTKNQPAVQFYLKQGFQIVKTFLVAEGLSLTCFQKEKK